MNAFGEHVDKDQPAATKPYFGVGCVVLAAGLFLGAVFWIGMLSLIESFGQPHSIPRITYAAGFAQMLVAMVFGVSGAMYLRKAARAKAALCVAVVLLILEAPLVLVAFSALVASRS